MELRKLEEQEMVQISAPWVADGHAVRSAIAAEPMMAGRLPKLTAAHVGIVAVSAQRFLGGKTEGRGILQRGDAGNGRPAGILPMHRCRKWPPGGCFADAELHKMATWREFVQCNVARNGRLAGVWSTQRSRRWPPWGESVLRCNGESAAGLGSRIQARPRPAWLGQPAAGGRWARRTSPGRDSPRPIRPRLG